MDLLIGIKRRESAGMASILASRLSRRLAGRLLILWGVLVGAKKRRLLLAALARQLKRGWRARDELWGFWYQIKTVEEQKNRIWRTSDLLDECDERYKEGLTLIV